MSLTGRMGEQEGESKDTSSRVAWTSFLTGSLYHPLNYEAVWACLAYSRRHSLEDSKTDVWAGDTWTGRGTITQTSKRMLPGIETHISSVLPGRQFLNCWLLGLHHPRRIQVSLHISPSSPREYTFKVYPQQISQGTFPVRIFQSHHSPSFCPIHRVPKQDFLRHIVLCYEWTTKIFEANP